MSEIVFKLTGDFIELFKLLKLTGLCESGGAAKFEISESHVKVDNQIETRKAFKVRRGQRIEYGGQIITIE